MDNRISRTLIARAALGSIMIVAVASAAFADDTWAEHPLNVPPPGYVALFNGHDLTGWKGLVLNPKTRPTQTSDEVVKNQKNADEKMNKHWKVVDGELMFDGAEFRLSGPICTVKQYGNFEMLVDWKIQKGGDSGIYLRGSPQVQIWDPDDRSQEKNGAAKGSGALWNNVNNERFPLVRADNPIGEWNRFRIRMVGDRVSVWLNGKLVTDNVVMENYWDRKQPIYPREQIELQNHNHPLYFRNVFIKELP
jgi:hypothetical protein